MGYQADTPWPSGPRPGRLLVRYCLALLLAGLFGGAPAVGQGPSEPWGTFETAHYRVHFHRPAEEWARRAAAHLESIRQRVSEEVGYRPEGKVDVLVIDPVARPNGSAWPIFGAPRMVLYTTPPGPESVLGYYRDWGELLLVHEDVHLVHLLRPSRNPLQRQLARVIPLGPIARKAPRWVSEGYATLLEGRLTATGRPHGDLRATVIRRWAQAGELPEYGRLASDSRGWMGFSMAYLVGSAYLEWLEERAGPKSLQHLWTRLTAVEDRSFDEAFRGVFGDSPRKLYNRFRAEVTYQAMTLEASRPEVGGAVWQDLAWTSGPPTVSPGGDLLAMVLRSRDAPSRLVVWSTGEDAEAEERRAKAREELLRRDPEDHPAVRVHPPAREPLHSLPGTGGRAPYTPRFLPGGDALLFVRYEPDTEGFLRPDLFRWRFAGGGVERLTHGAAVRDPDPAPDGDWAVAVRSRFGKSQLVALNLADGSLSALTEPDLETVWGHPRIAPDGSRLAVARHREGAWRLVVYELEGRRLAGPGRELPMPAGSTVAYPAWSGDTLYATLGQGGFLDIASWDLASGDLEPRWVTRTQGAALAPAPSSDGRLFFLGMESDGLDLRVLETPEPAERIAEVPKPRDGQVSPVVRRPVPEAGTEPPTAEDVEPARPYGLGRQELLPLVGGAWGPGRGTFELGFRLGDVVGRGELLALGAVAGQGVEGGALHWSYRGGPFELGLHLASARERLPGDDAASRLEYQGVELRLKENWRHRVGGLRLDFGGALGDFDRGPERLRRELVFADLRAWGWHELGGWRFDAALDLTGAAGRTEDLSWHRSGLGLEVGAGPRDGFRLGLGWDLRQAEDATSGFDRLQLGGVPGSILPTSFTGNRIAEPALAPEALSGARYEGQRIELRSGNWPLTAFYRRHRLWEPSGPRGDWVELWGLELHLTRAPWPLLRLPAVELWLGVAEVLEGPRPDSVEGWLSLRWSP